MLLLLWSIMCYLQNPFSIVWQVSLFPFYRCLNWGTERFKDVFPVAYGVRSGDGLEPQFSHSKSSCSRCLLPVIYPMQQQWQDFIGKWQRSPVPSEYPASALCESPGQQHTQDYPYGVCALFLCTYWLSKDWGDCTGRGFLCLHWPGYRNSVQLHRVSWRRL